MNKYEQRRDAALVELRELADTETTLEGADLEKFEQLEVEITDLNQRIEVLNAATRSGSTEIGEDRAPHFMKRVNRDVDVRTASRQEAVDAARATLEAEHKRGYAPIFDEMAEKLDGMFGRRSVAEDGTILFDGDAVARRWIATENDHYRSAFQKAMQSTQPAWTPEESAAVAQVRAAEQSLTNASGGYGVPVSLSPEIIITSGAAEAPLLSVSKIEYITSNVWKGVKSAGVAFANHSEGAEITASQATLAQPSITPETAAIWIPFSVEIQGDYPGFAQEMQKLIAQAYTDFLAVETATGTAGVVGVFTALDAVAASEVTVTTDGQLGPEDAIKIFKDLPERYRSRASWFMDVSAESEMRNASAMNGLYTTDLSTEGIGPLLGKRVLLSDYAPSFVGTTGAANIAVVGSFGDGYCVVQRVGFSLELVPHVVGTNGLPTLQRGFLGWTRVGADVIVPEALRLLQNT